MEGVSGPLTSYIDFRLFHDTAKCHPMGIEEIEIRILILIIISFVSVNGPKREYRITREFLCE